MKAKLKLLGHISSTVPDILAQLCAIFSLLRTTLKSGMLDPRSRTNVDIRAGSAPCPSFAGFPLITAVDIN